MKHRPSLPALAAAATLSLTASVANATVYIGVQNGGPIVTKASGATLALPLTWSGASVQFEAVSVSALGQPGTAAPEVLSVTTQASNSAGAANAGTVKVYVTTTDNTAASLAEFKSDFTAIVNTHAGWNWTETLQTYIDPDNGIFALTTPLSSATFNVLDSQTDTVVADTGSGPFYSVTAVFTITALTRGSATSDVQVVDAAIPEPTSLALLGATLAGFGIAARRRNRAA